MATATKTPSKLGRKVAEKTPADQLRKDRITAVVVLVLFAALMALMIWLASLGGGSTEPTDPMNWPMM